MTCKSKGKKCNWGTVVGRNCQRAGVQTCKVSTCGESRTGTKGTDPNGHNYEWIDDTRGNGGYSKCKRCDTIDHTR